MHEDTNPLFLLEKNLFGSFPLNKDLENLISYLKYSYTVPFTMSIIVGEEKHRRKDDVSAIPFFIPIRGSTKDQ